VEFVLHPGAHRTGTTALQQACSRNARRLARAGQAFWGPKVTRGRGLDGFFAVAGQAAGDDRAAREAHRLREMVRTDMDELRGSGVRRLLVSEENLPGDMVLNLRRRALYPKARARMAAFRELFPRPPDAVFFAIRDYADYWASAYAFSALRNDLPPFEELREDLIASRRGWRDVLADLRAALPESEVFVWVHERAPGLLGGVLARMLGPVAGRMRLPEGPTNARPSARALARGLRLRAQCPELSGRQLRERLEAEESPASPPFEPFSAEERAALGARFAAEVRALEAGALAGVRLISPGDGGTTP
jgi:hypothetical protein